MKEYTIIKNDYFEILIPLSLKKYGDEVLKYSIDKLQEFLSFFKEKSYNKKIKGAFLINRDDFIARIKEVSFPDVSLPPKWARGCFYGGETQILLDENNLYENFNTLAHESFHLLFSKFIYEKNNIDRIVWLDESLASNFDGSTDELIKTNKFEDIIIKLVNNNNLPKMNELTFLNENIITKEYNGYDLFKVVGRYLIEIKTKGDLLNYINNPEKVINDGETILEKSLNYFALKFNLKSIESINKIK